MAHFLSFAIYIDFYNSRNNSPMLGNWSTNSTALENQKEEGR